jgi:hypothetical protein
MRGQVAIELFLVASLVSLVLYWMGNFAGELQEGGVGDVALQERTLAVSLARLADQVAAAQVNATHTLPCMRWGTQRVAYTVTAAGNLVTVSSAAPSTNASALTANAVSGSFVVACADAVTNNGTLACLSTGTGQVQLASGGCSA